MRAAASKGEGVSFTAVQRVSGQTIARITCAAVSAVLRAPVVDAIAQRHHAAMKKLAATRIVALRHLRRSLPALRNCS